jgi:hypothetical protein
LAVEEREAAEAGLYDVWLAKQTTGAIPARTGSEEWNTEIISVGLAMIHDVSSVRVYMPAELRHFMLRFELYASLLRAKAAFPDEELPLISARELNLSSDKTLARIESLEVCVCIFVCVCVSVYVCVPVRSCVSLCFLSVYLSA